LQVLNEKNKKAKQKSYIWLKVSRYKYPIVLMHYCHKTTNFKIRTEIA